MPPRKKTDPPVGDDPSQLTDEELAAATEQASVDAGNEVRLAVGWPHDEFTFHDDEGNPVVTVTTDPTPVDADLVDEIKAAAKAADVTIRKVR